MQSIDKLIHAKWLVTGNTSQRILENHCLVIQQGKIIAIEPSETVQSHYQANETLHYNEHAIMPGFINAHTHIGMNFFRGLGSDLALMDWLTQYIFPAEKKWLTHDFVKDASLFAMAEMIRSGTTCFNDMFYFPEATAEAAIISGMRAFIGMTVIEFPTAWASSTDEYFEKCDNFYKAYQNHPFITPTFAPHAPYTVSDQSFMRIRELANTYQLKINLHLHETRDEIEQSLKQFDKRPIQRLHDLNFLDENVLAVHASQLNEEDIDILTTTKTQIIHCPESNMKLASGICPIETLLASGLNVALGTDSVASNNDLDMFSEMRSATFLSKIATMSPISLNADTTLRLATLHGAKALGVEKQLGSLETGKSADFIAVCLNDIETLPVYDPIVQIVYASNRQQVSDVWVAGKHLMKNRQLLTLNETELKEKAQYWGKKIKTA